MWYYFSFVNETGFLGACWVKAGTQLVAHQKTHALKINPGGEALILDTPLEWGDPPAWAVNRLLNKEELERASLEWRGEEDGKCKTLGELRDENPGMDIGGTDVCQQCNEGKEHVH